ncbi:MAG: glycosyltransferase [Beijerinckiaceae bacterium]|jgi:glycosyltransferase involved in cell wall biosynthesis
MSIRKIAVFHNGANVGSAWCCSEGIVAALKAEGYDVMDCGNPVRSLFALKDLQQADLIILSAPEWFFSQLLRNYGQAWASLTMPKISWYAESFQADDGRDMNFEILRPLADYHFFPAEQDAARFGGEWLPFGVDTDLFKPYGIEPVRDACFLGTLYPKRDEFIKTLTAPIEFLPAIKERSLTRSFQKLAEAYGSMKILVNFPSWSRLLVTKITEAMACGTFVLTPKMDHVSAMRNMEQFEDRKHLVYFDAARPDELTGLIRYYLQHEDERRTIAAAGLQEVRANHTLRGRLRHMISQAGRQRSAA